MSAMTAFLDQPPPVSGRSTPSLVQLVYVSSAVAPFSPGELVSLLEKSRSRNKQIGISGMLLYHDGNFMQLLEGEEEQVGKTHSRIVQDPRHRGCLTLIHGSIAERTFPTWSMGFRNLASTELSCTEGYNSVLNLGSTEQPFPRDGNRALKLLSTFRDNLR